MLNRPEPIRQASLLMVLATGIGQASTLLNGLKALAAESGAPWSTRVMQLAALLEQGQTLSQALSAVQGLLPEPTLIAIRVGEETGTLRQVLAAEAQGLMRTPYGNPARATLPSTLLWVVAIGMIAMAVVSFIMIFIIPKFKKIFDDFGVELPQMTNSLIGMSDWAMHYWYLALLPLITIVALTKYWFFRGYVQWVSHGRLFFTEHYPRFWTPLILRMLSITVAAESSISNGLHAILGELRPGRAANALSSVRMKVNGGTDCLEALYQDGFLNSREVMFLNSARRTRHLDWGMIHLSRTVLRRREIWAQRLCSFIQPCILLAVGFMVGFIVIALFLPLVKLLNDLS
ncbi:MAG: type II secretion system F family protein [Fuerstiella sp.]